MQLFKGDFQGAWQTAKDAVQGVGEQIEANKGNVDELNAAEEKYIQLKRRTLLENKQLEAEIAEARRIGNDEENYTAAQRKKALDEAISKQKQLAANKRAELDLETYIAETKASFGDNDIETNDKLNELKVQQFQITREQEMAIKRIAEDQQRVGRELAKEIDLQQTINRQIAERAANSGISTITTRTNFELGSTPDLNTNQLADMSGRIAETTERAREMKEEMEDTASVEEQIMSLSSSFGQLGSAIGGTTGHFLNMASSVLGMIPQLIAQITALTTAEVAGEQKKTVAAGKTAIAKGTEQSQSVPFPFNIIALAATIGSIIAALAKKPPKMASGGLVYGDSLVNVGEYANARVNPEVIAPLDKLQGIIGKSKSPGGVELIQPSVNIDGEKMYVMLQRVGIRLHKRT